MFCKIHEFLNIYAMEDTEIVRLYWDRNQSAIAETDKKYGKYCRKISFSILSNHEDSEECVNDTYLQTWNTIPPQKPERLATYIGKICRNLSINLYEKLNATKRGGTQTALCLNELEEVVGTNGGVEEQMEYTMLTEPINRFLSTLQEETLKIFVQRYWYMLSVREIADDLHISESKVKMSLLRTREKLKKHLQKEGYEI